MTIVPDINESNDVRTALAQLGCDVGPVHALEHLVQSGFGELPLPGRGATFERWRVLGAVAEHDLSLAKLYEGHTDAVAVQMELEPGFCPVGRMTLGMWASEAPGGRTRIHPLRGKEVRLQGTKLWCSGAAHVSHGLLTAWSASGTHSQLVRVDMNQPGIAVSDADWHAVGMAASSSAQVSFLDATGQLVGEEGAYLSRPGFWHGGAGVAACWHGGAVALANLLRRSLDTASSNGRDVFRLIALARIDLALQASAALLREAAQWIDENPSRDAHAVALRARLTAERCATLVLDEVGRAMGATPFCRDKKFARMAADLPVFVRQSHAERDLAALGERIVVAGSPPWSL